MLKKKLITLKYKFPAILDSFLLGADCIRQFTIWMGGGMEGRKDGGFKILKKKA